MKLFKKINRGLVLTVAVALGVIIYLVVMNFARANDRKQIQNLLTDFAAKYTQHMILPEEYSGNPSAMTDTQINAAADNFVAGCKPFFADNDICIDPLESAVSSNITAQKESNIPITDMKATVSKLSDFSFDGDTASVTAAFIIEYSGPSSLNSYGGKDYYGMYSSDVTQHSKSFKDKETFVLQKLNGEWKIFYFDGELFSYDYSAGVETIG